MTGIDPSIRRLPLRNAYIALRPDGVSRDIGQWYKASFLGSIACIFLYTVFGFIFVRHHAFQIAHEMALLQRFGMIPLIKPDDAYLISFIHQLGSALFFGLTLGVLDALICMGLMLPTWASGRLGKMDLPLLLVASIAGIYFGWSNELWSVSIAFGVLGPCAFVLPWIKVLRKGTGEQIRTGRWAVMTVILVAPFIIISFMSPSFLMVRDSMLEMPVVSSLSNFYYSHTLLAADVIKPPMARTQNVIAVARNIENIGPVPHGSLWIRTNDPCSIQGSEMVVSKVPLKCRDIVLNDNRPANADGRIFNTYGKIFDRNKQMRFGIGLFLFSGPLIIVLLLVITWLSLGLEKLSRRSMIAVVILIAAYAALFIPAWRTAYLALDLRTHPEKIRQYLDSHEERKSYLALASFPGALSAGDITGMIKKGSARIRLNALIEAGERRDPGLVPVMEQGLTDPQVNVRTKACWALGRMASAENKAVLENVVRNDPSWYVRDYAYAALERIRTDSKIVTLDR